MRCWPPAFGLTDSTTSILIRAGSPSISYEAENADLGGSTSAVNCGLCSGASKAGTIGGGGNGTVTFPDVSVPKSGTYQVEIDYLTSGTRSFFVGMNRSASFDLPLDADTFQTPASAVISMQLQAGINTVDLVRAITDLAWIESQAVYEKCRDLLGHLIPALGSSLAPERTVGSRFRGS